MPQVRSENRRLVLPCVFQALGSRNVLRDPQRREFSNRQRRHARARRGGNGHRWRPHMKGRRSGLGRRLRMRGGGVASSEETNPLRTFAEAPTPQNYDQIVVQESHIRRGCQHDVVKASGTLSRRSSLRYQRRNFYPLSVEGQGNSGTHVIIATQSVATGRRPRCVALSRGSRIPRGPFLHGVVCIAGNRRCSRCTLVQGCFLLGDICMARDVDVVQPRARS
mmetsp:Transcript_35269/g.76102  ORF Transcript_35269/g.76102 Transcript_35269/m.76102 type:complete len:222 (-) Transcript_35269:1066-1731(-)